MELSAILLLLGILIIVVLFVAQPFTEHWRVKVQSSREISSLLAERERAMNALQELDFDHELGKIPAEEYSMQRADLLKKGADILHRLDEIQEKPPAVSEVINKAITDQTKKQLSDEDLEDLIARRRSNYPQKTAGFCSKCGKPLSKVDKFCPSCGQAINQFQSQTNQ